MAAKVAKTLIGFLQDAGMTQRERRPVSAAGRARILESMMLLLMPGGQF